MNLTKYQKGVDYLGVKVGCKLPTQIKIESDNINKFNPSAWGHLNPSSYCDVGRLFYGVFKLWSKLQRKK